MKICLINNGGHIGISSIGNAYNQAFESLGLDFVFINFKSYPKMHNDMINMIIKSYLSMNFFDAVFMIQPTFIYSDTYFYLKGIKQQKGTKFYSINTEDPYSFSTMLQMSDLFDLKFTNEKICADRYQTMGFKYLPVAFNNYQNYKQREKEFDLTLFCSYYEDRVELKNKIMKLDCKKFIGGSIGYAMMHNIPMDLTGFTASPGLMPRYKEYELYSQSKFVLDPHRDPLITGPSDFNVPGKMCIPIVKEAVSPNPRFFDALGCGAIPLVNSNRTECFKILKTLLPEIIEDVITDIELNEKDLLLDLKKKLDQWEKYKRLIYYAPNQILSDHTYLNRAKTILEIIEES